MIYDVDEALRALIKRNALDGSDVEVVLDAPRKDWAARCTAPTINLYLYDIREVPSRRHSGMREMRDERGHITARKAWPRIFRLSYLVTAWTQRPEDEHRLLTSVLGCFMRHESFPPDLLSETLTASGEPPRISIAQAPPQDRQISEIWSALGGELKASLDLNVLASIETGVIEKAASLVREIPRLTIADASGRTEETGGRSGGLQTPGPAAGTPKVAAGVWTDDGAGELVTGGKDPEIGRSLRVRGMPRQ